MRQLQGQLHLMGSCVPDEDFTNLLVSSLPQLWDLFTISYLGSQTREKVLTSQQFIMIIHDEYNRRKAATGDVETVTTETALASSSKRVAKKRKAVESSSNEKKKACHTCGRDNHLAKDCFFKGKLKCTNCGCFNHEASDCRSAEKGKGKSTDSVTTQNGKHQKIEHVQQAHDIQEDEEMEDGTYVTNNTRMSAYTDITVNSWLADSATSSHLLNQLEAFKDFTPLNKIIRGVGDMDVPVKGRGTIKLNGQINGQTFMIVLRNVLYVPQAPNNLLSISRLDESGRRAVMGGGQIHLYHKNKLLIAVG